MNKNILLRVAAVFIYISLLFFLADSLSLAFFEVKSYYDKDNALLYYPLHFLTDLFGQNDLVLRAFMILLHIMSLWLYYLISSYYLVKERDRLWNIAIFVLLPSIVSSALIVHQSGLILLLLLLFVYSYHRWQDKALLLLAVYPFIDISFFILFLGMAVFFLIHRRWYALIFQIGLMALSIVYFGFLGKGLPVNYLDYTLSVASLVFSPLLFIYYLYTLFRVGLKREYELIWTLSLVALLLMLLLSIRQRVQIEHFAPYLILLLPLMVREFMHAYRIRIRALRKSYKIFFTIAILFLLLNSLSVYFNKYFYFFLDNPKEHFLYKHYIAKDLAEALKQKGWTQVYTKDEDLQLRLKFYGISKSKATHLLREGFCGNVTLRYNNMKIASFCVTKINNRKKY